jgi:hypothetical protein
VNAKLDGTKLSRNEALNVLLDSTDVAFHLTMALVEKHKKQESRIKIIQKQLFGEVPRKRAMLAPLERLPWVP